MSDATDTPENQKQDWRPTVFLPKTDFPMKAGLPQKEPAILAKWQSDDLYGRTIEVMLHHYLRPEARFEDLDALMCQIARDAEQARELLKP